MGEKIRVESGKLLVPNKPVIPFIEGDGTGPEIWAAASKVIDIAIEKVYKGDRKIIWKQVMAGEKAFIETGEYLPQVTLNAIKDCLVAIKGPLGTPIGGGFRSINVTLRQELDLYACIRPVKWIPGTPSPVIRPDLVDVVIFRENIEDVYAGIEWAPQSDKASQVIEYLNSELGCKIPEGAGIGVKYLSQQGAERIMRKALQYAIEHGRRTVTIVHKGNIMKYTEGAFKTWCYQLAKKEFVDWVITEEELGGANVPSGKILINDRIADNMFQQILLRSADYDVLVCPNLNGDYLSDSIAAQVGGLGMAPGANMGDYVAVFEATHGNAPKYTGLDKVNPGSVILSAVMMLEYIGWTQVADSIVSALSKTIQQKNVTYDLARSIEGSHELKTSQFADAVIANL